MGATVFVQPLDLVKNRMQGIKVLKGEKRPTSLSVLMGVVRNEGVKVIFHTLTDFCFVNATTLHILTFSKEIWLTDNGESLTAFARSTILT